MLYDDNDDDDDDEFDVDDDEVRFFDVCLWVTWTPFVVSKIRRRVQCTPLRCRPQLCKQKPENYSTSATFAFYSKRIDC